MLVVTNDAAGRTQADAVEQVVAELRAGGAEVEVARCGDDTDIAAVLDRRAGRTLVIVGGDGSLHAALRHLWRRGEAATCRVGLIPLGTGNDFARGCGIPLDPLEAARLVRAGTARPVDLITDDAGGVVVNAVHVGVGAQAALAARPLKRYLKVGAFPLGGLLAGVRAKGLGLKVVADGVTVAKRSRRVLMVGLSNAPTIAGGTAVLGPRATPTDGVVDVTVSVATGYLARIGYALRLIRGTHHARADVRYLTAKTVTVSGEPFHTNADGELDGPFTRRQWTTQPGAWRFILPEQREPEQSGPEQREPEQREPEPVSG